MNLPIQCHITIPKSYLSFLYTALLKPFNKIAKNTIQYDKAKIHSLLNSFKSPEQEN